MTNISKWAIFCIILFSGCSKKNSLSENKYQLSVDTLTINIPAEALDFYYRLGFNKEDNVLIGYNQHRHSIEFFDLNTNSYLKSIKLYKEGPNGVINGGNIFLTDQSIIINTIPEWVILDSNGTVNKRIRLDSYIDINKKSYSIEGGIKLAQLEKKFMSADGSYLYLNLMPLNVPPNSLEYYEHLLFCKMQLPSGKIEPLDKLVYPEVFKKGKYFGKLIQPSLIEKDNKMIYSFPNHSTIYEYNIETEQLLIFEAKSDKIKSVVDVRQSNNIREVIRSSYASDRYYPLEYDLKNKIFYRLIRVKNSTQNTNENYLQIINKEYRVIQEIYIDNNIVYAPRYIATDKGLLLQLKTSKTSELDFTYILINLNVKS